ncbi:heptaprenyl diphosphate synthase component 1 [Bacillus carboniphilus]
MKGDGMSVIHQLTTKIIEQYKDKTNHPYVQSVIYHPTLQEEKVYILTACMHAKGLNEYEIKNKLLATMLIQSALDVHDLVENDEVHQPLIAKQMAVLAGDYYSGLYYKVLADENDISFIQLLAKGTQEVNENKIRFTQKDYSNEDGFLKILENIEASIAKSVCHFVNAPQWVSLVSYFFLLLRLISEKKCWKESKKSQVVSNFRELLFPRNQTNGITKDQERFVLNQFNQMISEVQQKLEDSINQVSNMEEEVLQKMYSVIRQHKGVAISVVEEG